MNPYTLDVLALIVLAGLFTVWLAWSTLQLHRALSDPDHPDHEIAKEAIRPDPDEYHDPFRDL